MRKCNCSGHCGPQSDGLSRREFLELTAAGTAALLAGPAAGATFELPKDEFEGWKRELLLMKGICFFGLAAIGGAKERLRDRERGGALAAAAER